MSQASRQREKERLLKAAAQPGYQPRNPTASDRRLGAQPLTFIEFTILRDWQLRELARYADTPEAKARRAAAEIQFNLDTPLSFPQPTTQHEV